MVFEDTYMEWRDDLYLDLEEISPTSGQFVQDYILGDTDDSQLTERESIASIACD